VHLGWVWGDGFGGESWFREGNRLVSEMGLGIETGWGVRWVGERRWVGDGDGFGGGNGLDLWRELGWGI